MEKKYNERGANLDDEGDHAGNAETDGGITRGRRDR